MPAKARIIEGRSTAPAYPSSLFLLDAAYEPVLGGNFQTIRSNWQLAGFLASLLAFVLLSSLVVSVKLVHDWGLLVGADELTQALPVLLLAQVICDALLTMVLGSVFRECWLRSRLRRQGRLLGGIVTWAAGTLDSQGDYRVTLGYRFLCPTTQKPVEGRRSRVRNDLTPACLPAYGAPVALAYADCHCHLLL